MVDELRTSIAYEVRFDVRSRAVNATDESSYRCVPIAVSARPRIDGMSNRGRVATTALLKCKVALSTVDTSSPANRAAVKKPSTPAVLRDWACLRPQRWADAQTISRASHVREQLDCARSAAAPRHIRRRTSQRHSGSFRRENTCSLSNRLKQGNASRCRSPASFTGSRRSTDVTQSG